MTTIKKQLFVALTMMLVSAVALGTATYAWFVNNAAPSVDQMNFTASTATSLQVAVDKGGTLSTTGDASTDLVYVGAISNNDIKAYHANEYADIFSNSSANLLAPASLAAFSGTSAFYAASNYDSATWNANKFTAVTPGAASVKKIPLWFLSTTDMNVYFKNGTGIVASAPVGSNALSAQIDKSLRIAFVDHNTPTTYVICDVNGNVLDDANARKNTTIDENNVTALNGEAINTIETSGANLGMISDFATQTRYALADLTVTDASNDNMVQTAESNGKKALFSLTSGSPKLIDVYVWLEGCDYDCVSEVAGGALAIDLKFIGGAAPSGTAPTALGV